ncbi:hypothetical protein K9N50_09750 [bacterium]|nr:hypothetical protein [bacterium]
MVKAEKKVIKPAIESVRRPMPKPTTDMGDKTKYQRKPKFKEYPEGEVDKA